MSGHPGHGEALPPPSPLATLTAGDHLTDLLGAYGIDERSRSALRAGFRHGADGESDAAAAGRGALLLEALIEADPDCTADRAALAHFLGMFAALPEADFSADWLEQLSSVWKSLRRAGCAADLPLRAARTLVALGSRELLGDRSALSTLEVEMVAALAAGGMCVAEFLGREMRRGGRALAIDTIGANGDDLVFVDCLEAVLARADGAMVGLLALRMRIVTSTLSLDVGQRGAIVDAAIERLCGVLRESDIVVRTESHGCAIILPGLQSSAQVQLAARKVAQMLETPFHLNGLTAHAAFALGAVWFPEHGRDAGELIRCVDLAVETALRTETPVVLFDERLLMTARQEALIEKEFPAAMENGSLSIHVQPQIDLRDGRCVGGELLLRWTNSQGFEVPPWQIPEVAQRLGVAPQLTRWLVFGACRILAELAAEGVEIGLSVNLMGRDLMDSELPVLVEQALAFWRVPPTRLTLELIESAVLGDPTIGAEVMNRLIDLGVSTSIDDFGIGYSSILYLRQLPLHELKIDRVFVDALPRSQEDREIVAALIRLAHGLDLRVVAEGVENEQTAHLLREMGCDRGQGYWIGRAMPAAQLPGWIHTWDRKGGYTSLF